MDKKFTICVPYKSDFKTQQGKDLAKFEICCNADFVNDKLKYYGSISLNEVLRTFRIAGDRTYSYCWGWDYYKHKYIDVTVIRNSVNDHIWYLKFTAYDIVE